MSAPRPFRHESVYEVTCPTCGPVEIAASRIVDYQAVCGCGTRLQIEWCPPNRCRLCLAVPSPAKECCADHQSTFDRWKAGKRSFRGKSNQARVQRLADRTMPAWSSIAE